MVTLTTLFLKCTKVKGKLQLDEKHRQKCILVAIRNKVKLRFDGVTVRPFIDIRVHVVHIVSDLIPGRDLCERYTFGEYKN